MNCGVDEVRFTQLDANGEVGQTTTLTTKVKFRRARGAFVVGGPHTPWFNGRFLARTITTRGFGTSGQVDLFGGRFGNDAASVTGILVDLPTRRIYYTLEGRDRLYWRWFNPESQLVGAVRFPMSAGRLPTEHIAGMFASDGWLYFARADDGGLYRIRFDAGSPGSPGAGVTGRPRLVDDGRRWTTRGLTVLPS
ncbi:MAG: hypothetical protein R2734_09845 [Nocardioides sp.]